MENSRKIINELINSRTRKKARFGRKNIQLTGSTTETHIDNKIKIETKNDNNNKQTINKNNLEILSGDFNDNQEKLIVRAMISAAKADGYFGDFERSRILSRFENIENDEINFIKRELDSTVALSDLAENAKVQNISNEIYLASILSIEIDSDEEEEYINDLSSLLGLSEDTVLKLHNIKENYENNPSENETNISLNQWYFELNGEEIGPMHLQLASQFSRSNPEAKCWREGMDEWVLASKVEAFQLANQPVLKYSGKKLFNDEIDFKIFGTNIQCVEVELDPDETVIAEPGALMYKSDGVDMKVVLGSGAGEKKNIISKILSAGERALSGENFIITSFTNLKSVKSQVAFSAPYPGEIVPVKLSNFGNRVICQKDCFLAAAKGVEIGLHFQRKITSAFFGGEGFIMQALKGDGWAFMHAGGSLVERDLDVGEIIDVETGSVVGFTDTVKFDVRTSGGAWVYLWGGEGLFLTRLTGPGRIWLQTQPILKLASRLQEFLPKTNK